MIADPADSTVEVGRKPRTGLKRKEVGKIGFVLWVEVGGKPRTGLKRSPPTTCSLSASVEARRKPRMGLKLEQLCKDDLAERVSRRGENPGRD